MKQGFFGFLEPFFRNTLFYDMQASVWMFEDADLWIIHHRNNRLHLKIRLISSNQPRSDLDDPKPANRILTCKPWLAGIYSKLHFSVEKRPKWAENGQKNSDFVWFPVFSEDVFKQNVFKMFSRKLILMRLLYVMKKGFLLWRWVFSFICQLIIFSHSFQIESSVNLSGFFNYSEP